VSAAGGVREVAKLTEGEIPEIVVVISVNAETDPPKKLDLSAASPSFAALMGAVSGSQIRRINFETLQLTRESLRNWVNQANRQGLPMRAYMVEVALDNLTDPEERDRLKNLPTSFKLKDEEVDALRAAGRTLLEESPDFQDLLRSLEETESISP
jgi:hypothetical protein